MKATGTWRSRRPGWAPCGRSGATGVASAACGPSSRCQAGPRQPRARVGRGGATGRRRGGPAGRGERHRGAAEAAGRSDHPRRRRRRVNSRKMIPRPASKPAVIHSPIPPGPPTRPARIVRSPAPPPDPVPASLPPTAPTPIAGPRSRSGRRRSLGGGLGRRLGGGRGRFRRGGRLRGRLLGRPRSRLRDRPGAGLGSAWARLRGGLGVGFGVGGGRRRHGHRATGKIDRAAACLAVPRLPRATNRRVAPGRERHARLEGPRPAGVRAAGRDRVVRSVDDRRSRTDPTGCR